MKVYFISGHLNLSKEEFETHYQPLMDKAIQESNVAFVVGDARGCDAMAQDYLYQCSISTVTIFHLFHTPRNNVHGYAAKGGFRTDEERDAAMTQASDADILWIRPLASQKALLGKKFRANHSTGTEKNKLRRK